MNNKLIKFSLLGCLLLFLFNSCSKSELLNQDIKTFRLTITGSSTDTLEYLTQGKVVATTPASSSFNIVKVLALPAAQEEIQIRKKGSNQVLASKHIFSAPYDQKISIFYDGTTIYDKLIQIAVKGYSVDATLELVLDNQVLASGTQRQFPEYIYININDGQTRDLKIRRQGETEILSTKTINSLTDQQSLTFFYDGKEILSNLNLTPPSNPANISISIKFTPQVANFAGGPVDIVFYALDQLGQSPTEPTGHKMTLPLDGSFSPAIELPPLPEGSFKVYAFKVLKSGTTDAIPYNTAGDITPVKTPFFSLSSFVPGKAQLWLMSDTRVSRAAPVSIKGTTYGFTITNIADFF